jgi:SsrA-binding protein
MNPMPKEQGQKVIARNKKARHEYTIEATYEAGISLTGTEVKSLRAGRASLVDGYAVIKDAEVWLQGVHIAEYTEGTWTNHVPRRNRKLLLHRAEINKLIGKTKESGLTLIPLELYFKDGKVKVEIGLARGKKTYDKRQTLMERQNKREAERAMASAFKRNNRRG